jgi:hypothetical protein
MKISKKYEQKLTLVIMVLVMTFVVTFVGTIKNIGFTSDFILQWLKAWGFAYVVALPAVMLIMPLIKIVISKMIYNDKPAS